MSSWFIIHLGIFIIEFYEQKVISAAVNPLDHQSSTVLRLGLGLLFPCEIAVAWARLEDLCWLVWFEVFQEMWSTASALKAPSTIVMSQIPCRRSLRRQAGNVKLLQTTSDVTDSYCTLLRVN